MSHRHVSDLKPCEWRCCLLRRHIDQVSEQEAERSVSEAKAGGAGGRLVDGDRHTHTHKCVPTRTHARTYA